MMTQTARFAQNLSLLSAKGPLVAWKLGECSKAHPKWIPFTQNAEVCFVLGVAGGLSPLLPYLEGDQHLVLADFKSAPFRAFLEEEESRLFLSHPNVHVTLLDSDAAFQYLQGLFSGLTAEVKIHPAYRDDPLAKEASFRLLNESQAAYRVVDELLHYPHIATSNILANLSALPHSTDAALLFGKFPKVPAVICGAGPSLDKHLPRLAPLTDRALLFAPGSALNALSAYGVRPHFGCGLDPYYAQYQRLMMGSGFEVPLFYTGRWLPAARECTSSPLLYVSGTEHPVSRWIDDEHGIGQQKVIEGTSGVHLCTELARLMGCDPIVFVGMDLAYTDGALYSSGVQEERNLEKRMEGEHYLDGLVQRNAICGTPVWTQWKWIEEAKTLSDYAEKYPTTTFLNATGGGLGLGSIANAQLDKLSWADPSPLEERVRVPMQTHIQARPNLLEAFSKSVVRCKELLGELLGLPEGGKRALLEVELEEELVYRTHLDWPLKALLSRIERGYHSTEERYALLLEQVTHLMESRNRG